MYEGKVTEVTGSLCWIWWTTPGQGGFLKNLNLKHPLKQSLGGAPHFSIMSINGRSGHVEHPPGRLRYTDVLNHEAVVIRTWDYPEH
jgi:hypothetical protein